VSLVRPATAHANATVSHDLETALSSTAVEPDVDTATRIPAALNPSRRPIRDTLHADTALSCTAAARYGITPSGYGFSQPSFVLSFGTTAVLRICEELQTYHFATCDGTFESSCILLLVLSVLLMWRCFSDCSQLPFYSHQRQFETATSFYAPARLKTWRLWWRTEGEERIGGGNVLWEG